jgi:hypothetical protein
MSKLIIGFIQRKYKNFPYREGREGWSMSLITLEGAVLLKIKNELQKPDKPGS